MPAQMEKSGRREFGATLYPPRTSDRHLCKFCRFWRNVESISYEDSMGGDNPSPVVPAILLGRVLGRDTGNLILQRKSATVVMLALM
jgi:hypothetical protein